MVTKEEVDKASAAYDAAYDAAADAAYAYADGDPIDSFVICPKCDRRWAKISEQGVSVQWHDECVVCKFTTQGKGSNDGTKEELDLVSAESMKRRTGQHVCI